MQSRKLAIFFNSFKVFLLIVAVFFIVSVMVLKMVVTTNSVVYENTSKTVVVDERTNIDTPGTSVVTSSNESHTVILEQATTSDSDTQPASVVESSIPSSQIEKKVKPSEVVKNSGTKNPPVSIDKIVPVTVVPPALVSSIPVVSSQGLGISLGETLFNLSDAELNAVLDDFVDMKLAWLRFDLSWRSVQWNENGNYHWANVDRLVKAANARGIKLLPVMSLVPEYARSPVCSWDLHCPPADPEAFAAFIGKAVERYSPQGIYAWEIWNEPNIKIFWNSGADVEDYIAVLKAAHRAIKSRDSHAVVISGGVGPIANGNGNIAAVDFIDELYNQGGNAYFDAVGFHPYTFPVSPSYDKSWNAWQQMANTKQSVRSIMTSHGDSTKQIWLTEFGAPTNGSNVVSDVGNIKMGVYPNHVTESLQTEIIMDAIYDTQNYTWDGPLFLYSYKDLGTTTNTIENFFGLIRYDDSHKPVYNAIKNR